MMMRMLIKEQVAQEMKIQTCECSSLRANVGATCWSFEDLESWKSAPLSFYFYAKHYTIMNKNL